MILVRSIGLMVAMVGWAVGAWCQPGPAIDMKDPAAVAQAYGEACRQGDGKALLALVDAADPGRTALSQMVSSMADEMARAGYDPADMLTEFMFMPLNLKVERQLGEVKQDGDTARVTLKATPASVDQRFVLARQPDGTWRIKLVDSVRASTSSGKSMIADQGGLGGARGPNTYESQNRLRQLFDALQEYAGEHGGNLPPADRWVDELQPYVFDQSTFQSPAAPDQPFGYAMNEELSGQPLQKEGRVTGTTLLLAERPGPDRNARGTADALLAQKGPWADGTRVVLTVEGQAVALSAGMNLADWLESQQTCEMCSQHLHALAKAARRHAHEHDGLLPGAESWQEDLIPYLLGDDAVLTCPAAPDLKYAYAINRDLAGKNARDLVGQGMTVLFFESDANVPNAAGTPGKDAPPAGRHRQPWGQGGRVNLVVYLNGPTGEVPVFEPEP